MMKMMLCLAVCLVIVQHVYSLPTDAQLKVMFDQMVKDCRASEKPTDADLKAYAQDQIPASREGKCFTGCMFEKLGLIVNGVFSRANAEKMAKEDYANQPKKIEEAKKAFGICEKDIGAKNDKCDTGPALLVCIAKYDKM